MREALTVTNKKAYWVMAPKVKKYTMRPFFESSRVSNREDQNVKPHLAKKHCLQQKMNRAG